MDVGGTIIKIVNGAGFVAVPFIAGIFGLDWYFTRDGKSAKAVFIAVGGILSAVLYSYLAWTEPTAMLVQTSILWYFGLAALSVVIYYGLHEAYGGRADPPAAPPWLLPVALLSYIGLLSAIGVFCAAALARHDYLLLGGSISSDNKPVPDAIVLLQDTNRAPLRETVTDANGRFLLTLKYSTYTQKDDDEKPARLLIKSKGFVERSADVDGHPNENLKFTLVRRSNETIQP